MVGKKILKELLDTGPWCDINRESQYYQLNDTNKNDESFKICLGNNNFCFLHYIILFCFVKYSYKPGAI